MKVKQKMMMAALTLCAMAALSMTAQADPVNFSLTNAAQVGTPNSVLTFAGTFANLGDPSVVINGSSFNFDQLVDLTLDSSAFDLNFDTQSVASGASIGGDVFTVTIGSGVAPGVYTGLFSVFYNGLTFDQEVFQTFSITVRPGGQPIPEPMTLVLLGSGLAGLAGVVRRRKASSNE